MQKKIQDLIRGKYQYERPALIFSSENAEFRVLEEETFQGNFQIRSADGTPVRGYIAADSPRMQCEPSSFDSPEVTVRYTYTARGEKEGDTESGLFVVTSESGEFTLPFSAQVKRFYHRSSIGQIKTLNDFTNLAKLNWDEALSIFRSRYFPGIFPDENTRLLYEGLCLRQASSAEMEEFLIGTGRKTRVQISVERSEMNFGQLRTSRVDAVRIQKSGWGYTEIRLRSEAPFLKLKTDHVRNEDFSGKEAVVPFLFQPEQMHQGKNSGEIVLSMPLGEQRVKITAVRTGSGSNPETEDARYRCRSLYLLEKQFIDFRLGKTSREEWKKSSLEVLNRTIRNDPSDTIFYLFKCHVLYACNRYKDAEWTLKDASEQCGRRFSPLWCYARVLEECILAAGGQQENGMNRSAGSGEKGNFSGGHPEAEDPENRPKSKASAENEDFLIFPLNNSRLRQELEEASRRNPDDILIFWLRSELLLTRPGQKTQNQEEYYENLKKLCRDHASPLLYLRASDLLRARPNLIGGLEEEEIRILCWIAGQSLLTEKMAKAVFQAAGSKKNFSTHFYRLLCSAWSVAKSEAGIRAVCTYLIKNNISGEAYLIWFSRALENRMRIAGLCEAYIQSWKREDGEIPWKVLQYFSKKTALPAFYKAKIYAYAVRNRDQIGKEWHAYERLIGDFVTGELKKHHMSDDLAELCIYLLENDATRAEDPLIAESAAVYKVVCTEYPFSSTVVCENGREKGTAYPFTGGTAYVSIFGEPWQILFENSYGRRCFLQDGYHVERMIPEETAAVLHVQAEEQAGNVGKPRSPETLSTGEAAIEISREKDGGPESENESGADIRAHENEGGSLIEFAGCIDSLDRKIRERASAGENMDSYCDLLLARMLFTEHFPKDHADYFRSAAERPEARDLCEAYISYFSWRYLWADETVPQEIFAFLDEGMQSRRDLNRCCETALFKYFCRCGWDSAVQEKFTVRLLKQNLADGICFPFYESLPEEWKRRFFIHDTRYISVSTLPGKQLYCRLSGSREKDEAGEEHRMEEMFPGLYVLPVRIYAGGGMEYSVFLLSGERLKSGTLSLSPREIATAETSRYQALNQALEEAPERTDKLKKYAELSDLTKALFRPR